MKNKLCKITSFFFVMLSNPKLKLWTIIDSVILNSNHERYLENQYNHQTTYIIHHFINFYPH